MKIFIASDHAGLELKNKLKRFLKTQDRDIRDLGAFNYDKQDDYPDYVEKLAKKLKKERQAKGILVCSSGVGVSLAANKFSYIRAVNACSKNIVISSRKDNNTNVICFGQKYVSFKKAKKILQAWLKTDFSKQERHKRRLKKIENYE
ncbi:MAG TPA: ribose 5-phosphate isomerase B [Patescibacteria group bacterium]|nr:ribose 5-phosphate isomerase B [Patescibacteria group bacterium]